MKTKKFDFQNFVGLSFRLKDKEGNVQGVIRVKSINESPLSILCDDGSEFVCDTKNKKWYLIYLGLSGERCVKHEYPYTLWPVEIGCVSRSKQYVPFWLLPTNNQKIPQ